jgi:hypothetical protein
MRPSGAPPIEVVQRIFTEPPFVVPGLEPMTVDQLTEAVHAARDAGITHVVIDSVFTTKVVSQNDWATMPDALAPVLQSL